MITISIKTNNVRRSVNEDVNSTPANVLESIGLNAERNTFYLSGEALDESEIRMTFADLGVEDGDEIVLSSIVKGDGGSSF